MFHKWTSRLKEKKVSELTRERLSEKTEKHSPWNYLYFRLGTPLPSWYTLQWSGAWVLIDTQKQMQLFKHLPISEKYLEYSSALWNVINMLWFWKIPEKEKNVNKRMENIYTSVHYGIRSMGRKYTNKIELIHLGQETLAHSSLNSLWIYLSLFCK